MDIRCVLKLHWCFFRSTNTGNLFKYCHIILVVVFYKTMFPFDLPKLIIVNFRFVYVCTGSSHKTLAYNCSFNQLDYNQTGFLDLSEINLVEN